MALPNTDISISAVKNAVGAPTYLLTEIIGDAKTGGTGGEAFDADGYLIAGAAPYWNVFSYNIPGEWDYSNGPLELRLYRDPPLPTGFGNLLHRLGDFRGYNHDAQAPQVAVGQLVAVSGAGDVGVLMNMHEWHLPIDVTHIRVKITIGGATQYILIPLEDVNYEAELIQGYTSSFSGIGTGTTSGSVWLYASNSGGSELADITALVSGSSSISFAISHSSSTGTLARVVGYASDPNLTLSPSIISPVGSGSIKVPAGDSTLSGITIRVTAVSSTVSNFSFDLYLQQTGETDLFIGSYNGMATSEGFANDYFLDTITLEDTVAGGDNLGFIMSNLSY